MTSAELPLSTHFQLQEVVEGVFAAIVDKDGLAIGNAGIIDLGEQTLVLDTFENPLCAQDLRLAAETLTGRPATMIVNSHEHADHWFGNQVFAPSTPIVATPTTFERMAEYLEEVLEAKDDPSEYHAWIENLNEDLADTADTAQRKNLQASIRRAQGHLAALPTLELRRPNLLFEEKLLLSGTKRSAELVSWGAGHTRSDAMLLLPEEKIVFTADICFFGTQPYMGSADPDAWVAQLNRLAESSYETFVPGHGPIGSHEEIRLLLDYFHWLEEAVLRAIKAQLSPSKFLEQPMPTPFAAWSPGGLPSESNVQMMFKKLGKLAIDDPVT